MYFFFNVIIISIDLRLSVEPLENDEEGHEGDDQEEKDDKDVNTERLAIVILRGDQNEKQKLIRSDLTFTFFLK